MDIYDLFLDICLLLCGIKGIRLCKETLRCGHPIEGSILCPRGVSIKNHPNGGIYCQEVCPRLRIMSVVLILCGAVNILTSLALPDHSRMILSICISLLVLAIIWFGISLSGAQKKYFNL